MNHRAFNRGVSGLAIGIALITGPVSAQTGTSAAASSPSEVGAPSAQTPDYAADIIVTGEKRATSINRVGLTMSAIGGDALKAQGISNVEDLAKVVPGLTYAQSTTGAPVYTLRGVGFYDSSLAAYPDVSVYVDQIPLPFPSLTTQAGLDPERVEVLKGPQGILFGQNATGGAINYIAAKPTAAFKAGVDVSYGRFDRLEANGFVSGPITDQLRARLAVRIVKSDDWQYRMPRAQNPLAPPPRGVTGTSQPKDPFILPPYPVHPSRIPILPTDDPKNTTGAAEEYVARLLVDWEPSDSLTIGLNVNGWIDRTDPQSGQFSHLNLQNPTAVMANARLALVPQSPRNARATDWDIPPRKDDYMYQFAGTVNYAISDDVTATSITSYAYFKKDAADSNDGLPFRDLVIGQHDGRIKTFSQELRLANGSASAFRWTLGGNIERSKVFDRLLLDYSDSSLVEVFDVVGGYTFSDQKMKNSAIFANGEYDVMSDLTVKAGVRYTDSRRSFKGCNFDAGDGRFTALFQGISRALTGTNVTIGRGECPTLNGTTFLPELFVNELNEDNVSYRLGLDYRASPSTLIYANVTKGYKSGGYPTAAASTTTQFLPVVQESVLAYEAGIKARLLDRRLTFNAAAFYYDYKNKQVRAKLNDPIFGILDRLSNVPKSHVTGVEFSLAGQPINGLNVSVAATYLDSSVDRFTSIDLATTQLTNFKGTRLPFAAKVQASGAIDYEWELFQGYHLSVGSTLTYNSRTSSSIGGGALFDLKPYTLLDLRASISDPDRRWTLSVYGKNVTNTFYWSNVAQIYNTSVRYTGMPVTYGARIAYRL